MRKIDVYVVSDGNETVYEGTSKYFAERRYEELLKTDRKDEASISKKTFPIQTQKVGKDALFELNFIKACKNLSHKRVSDREAFMLSYWQEWSGASNESAAEHGNRLSYWFFGSTAFGILSNSPLFACVEVMILERDKQRGKRKDLYWALVLANRMTVPMMREMYPCELAQKFIDEWQTQNANNKIKL